MSCTLASEAQLENIDDFNSKRLYSEVCRLYDKMYIFINQIPVIGFRSGKYDLLVIRARLIEKLELHIPKGYNSKSASKFVIKRARSYPCISTKDYQFLDITEYVGSHVSYSQFLKSMKVNTGRKIFFTYEALKSFSDLDQ